MHFNALQQWTDSETQLLSPLLASFDKIQSQITVLIESLFEPDLHSDTNIQHAPLCEAKDWINQCLIYGKQQSNLEHSVYKWGIVYDWRRRKLKT